MGTIGATIGLGVGTFGSVWAWARLMATARAVEDAPRAKVRSAAQGYHRFFGFARTAGGEPMKSPLTGTPCVWWEYHVVMEQQGEDEKPLRESRRSSQPFYIDDGSGHCLVDPAGAEITGIEFRDWTSRHSAAPDPTGLPPPSLGEELFNAPGFYRCREAVLRPGTRLSVLGEFRTDRVQPSALDRMQQIVKGWLADPMRRTQLDLNGDGQIDPDELAAARRAAMLQARTEVGTEVTSRDVIAQPRDGRAFLIATLTPGALAQGERAGSFVFLGLAIAFGLIFFVALLGLR